MKLCILMWYDNNIASYADINYEINKKYCDKYGYDIIKSNERTYLDRKPHYERIPLLLKYISQYDYVIWIDADAHFYLDSPPITNVINTYNNYPFIFSGDIYRKIIFTDYEQINTGFFIVKNTDKSINFLKEWGYNNLYLKYKHGLNDQGVVTLMYDQNILNIKNISIIINYGILQHFGKEKNLININKYGLNTTPFILHYAGEKNNDELTKRSTEYLNNQVFNVPLLEKNISIRKNRKYIRFYLYRVAYFIKLWDNPLYILFIYCYNIFYNIFNTIFNNIF
jgi:hypothetical protein